MAFARRTALFAGLGQAAGIALLAVILAVTLDRQFFEEWGFLAGPAAWLLVAAAVATTLRLPLASALIGATLAGAPSVVFVVLGVHWAGTPIGVLIFALWCGRLARDRGLVAEAV